MPTEEKDTFYVDKLTGAFGDPLMALGLAEVFYRVTGGDVVIHDVGTALQLNLKRSLDEAAIQGAAGLDLLKFLETKNAPPPEGIVFRTYDHERELENNYFAWLRSRSEKAARSAPDDQPEGPPKPDEDLPLFKLVNQMSAITAYNEVVQRWHEDRALWPEYLRLLAQLFGTRPNDIAAAEAAWKGIAKRDGLKGGPRVTAAQILNPTMGKGGDATKSNSAAPGNKDSFWLIELLKFIGAKVAAVPLKVRMPDNKAKDRKTYVPLPVNLSLAAHKRLMAGFREHFWANTAVKMDVMGGLIFAREFLQQWHDGNLAEHPLLRQQGPSDFVSGLQVAFYKDMGSAVALLNLAQIRLPNWARVSTHADSEFYLDLIGEHIKLVQSLEETHSDEYALLVVYRDFLSGHDLDSFYDFAAGYGRLTMRRLDRGQHAPQVTIANLEVLLMGHTDVQPELKQILASEGFMNLAQAIRLSTIVPQGQKARKQRPLYEIRYGLGDELKRKSAYPDELAQAIGDFVHSYEQETMQVLERTGQQRRKQVTTGDLAEVIGLIATHGSRTIGMLLVAFGYARAAAATPEGAAPEAVESPVGDTAPFMELDNSMDMDE